MKTPHLLASFAVVAVSASAADLKDPASVVREWNESAVQSPVPLTGDLSLKAQTAPMPRLPPIAVYRDRAAIRNSPPSPPSSDSRQPDSLYDAPFYRVPEKLPNNRPRGAVPWEHNGEVYWLVPLGAPTKD